MLKKFEKILAFLFFFLFIFINGQSNSDFSILVDKAFQKLYQNPDDCISYTQGLLNNDQNTEHALILKTIIGQAFSMKGDFVQSVNTTIPLESTSHQNILLISKYNLADKYQNLGLYHQSQKIINDILNTEYPKSNTEKKNIFLAKIYQLEAINFAVHKDYKKALNLLKKSNNYLSYKTEEEKIISLENNIFEYSYQNKIKPLEKDQIKINQTISQLEKTNKYPFITAFAYENRAKYYFSKGNYNASITDLEQALTKLGNSPFFVLKTKIYEALSKNYLANRNDEKYHFYNKLYNDNQNQIAYSVKEGIRYIVKQVETAENSSESQFTKKKETIFWLKFALIILLILSFLGYYFNLKNKNKDLKKQFSFLEKQKETLEKHYKNSLKIVENTTERLEENKIEKEANKISKEKEDEILKKLEIWETTHEYLNKNMSLALLSTQMEINSKYLSEVIKNKSRNFNSYINELRINRIAYLLKTNPTFLNYKVSYLAEYCGFSSHSAFTTIFKSVTGMSPNTYIQEISKTKKI